MTNEIPALYTNIYPESLDKKAIQYYNSEKHGGKIAKTSKISNLVENCHVYQLSFCAYKSKCCPKDEALRV